MSLLQLDSLFDVHHLGKHSTSSSKTVTTTSCPVREIQPFSHVRYLFHIVEILPTPAHSSPYFKWAMEITEEERESHMHREPLCEELFFGELHVHKD